MKVRYALALMALAASAPAAMAQSGSSSSGLTYEQQLTPQGIRYVQARLRQLDLYQGKIDGNWGADSEAALDRFQQTRGLLVTGQLNQATMKTLDIDAAATLGMQDQQSEAPDQDPRNNTAGSQQHTMNISRNVIKEVQGRLHRLNFDPGRSDGVWGASTQAALKRFQQVRALQPTGQLNPPTISALGINPNGMFSQNGQATSQ